jgi:hypothetical protein
MGGAGERVWTTAVDESKRGPGGACHLSVLCRPLTETPSRCFTFMHPLERPRRTPAPKGLEPRIAQCLADGRLVRVGALAFAFVLQRLGCDLVVQVDEAGSHVLPFGVLAHVALVIVRIL